MNIVHMCVYTDLEGHELGVWFCCPCVDLNACLSANAEKLHLSMLHHPVVDTVLKFTNRQVAVASTMTVILGESEKEILFCLSVAWR